MSRLVRLVCAVCVALAVLLPGAARAGEALGCFKGGVLGSCREEALPHVAFKSVVLQFVDPDRTALGEGMARLLWREILESVSDLEGAGVILAYDRSGAIERALGESDLGAFLQRDYHDAASRIAEQQDVQMSVWGAVLEDGDDLFVQTFLTLRDTPEGRWTAVSLKLEAPVRTALEALLARPRINLPPVRGPRSELFDRWLVTRCALDAGCPAGVDLRGAPSNDAAVVAHAPEGGRIRVTDMRGQWLRLAPAMREGDGARWINVYHVEMFPEFVEFHGRRNVNLRAGPGGERITQVDLDARFRVLDAARHGRFDEPWYRIEVDGRRGWVAGRLVNRRSYVFPGVHLIAGLYRYGRGQYEEAGREFSAFLEGVPAEDNVTRAAVLKFLAASRLAEAGRARQRVGPALESVEAAADLTPFDSSVYTLRALIRAGAGGERELEAATRDLRHALELDPRDTGALHLLDGFSRLSDTVGLQLLAPGQPTEPAEETLQLLRERYRPDAARDGAQ